MRGVSDTTAIAGATPWRQVLHHAKTSWMDHIAAPDRRTRACTLNFVSPDLSVVRLTAPTTRLSPAARRASLEVLLTDARCWSTSSRPLAPVRPGILGYMSMEKPEAVPGPDDFDRQLRDVTSGAVGAARYREPSAIERARRAAQPGGPLRISWRNARRARMLRKPVTAGSGSRPSSGRFWLRARLHRGRLSAIRRPTPGSRRRRLVSLAKGAGILAGFVALLFLMHMLGLGPH